MILELATQVIKSSTEFRDCKLPMKALKKGGDFKLKI